MAGALGRPTLGRRLALLGAIDQKIIYVLAGLELGDQPTRLLTPTCPRFHWVGWILKFGKYGRIFPANHPAFPSLRSRPLDRCFARNQEFTRNRAAIELRQALFQFAFFCRNLFR